mmetsp:Transcript_76724/g.167618  ORF Transcript_76724/g.167618 Transcript_76724/m.167618 type:complete len:256 (+) Transcript_76724:116-883(+)
MKSPGPSAPGPKKLAESSCRGEVVVTEDHLVVIISIVLREETQLAEEIVGLQDQGLTDLQREDTLVGVGGDAASRHIRGARDNFASREHADDLLEPLLAAQCATLLLRHIGHNGQLLNTSREDHLADVAGAALALLFGGVRLGIHGCDRLLQELKVAFRLIDGCAEELQATHVSSTLDLDSTLATFLDDLLQFLGWILGRLLVLLLGRLLLLLLLRLLDVLLVQFHLLQGVGLGLDSNDPWDLLHCLQEGRLWLE